MTFNIINIKQEQVVFLRNEDIFTISQRGVTTTSATGTFSLDSSFTISKTDVKNIRSITINSVSKALGTDYTVDYKHTNGCVITFTSAQTGDYTIPYDYGSDKIYSDFPRDDLTIDSYPRIAIDILNAVTEPFGIGGSKFISDVALTVVVYDDDVDDVDGYIQTIKDAYVSNSNNFFYLSFIKPTSMGPLINSPDRSNEIVQRNLDLLGMFNVD